MSNSSIRPIHRTLSGHITPVEWVHPGTMAMKGYSVFPQSSSITEPTPSDFISKTGKQSRQKLKKINELLTNIPMNIITKWNELIYAGTKLLWEKIWVSLMNTNRNSKPGLEIRLETQIKKIYDNKQKCKDRRKKMRIFWDEEKKSNTIRKKLHLEEINRKVLAKEGRLKKIPRQNQTIQPKQDIPKQQMKNFTKK